MNIRTAYHSNVIINYKLGLLDRGVVAKIPKSTKHNWSKYDVKKLFGYQAEIISNDGFDLVKTVLTQKKALAVMRAVVSVCILQKRIINSVKSKAKHIRNQKIKIVRLIEKYKSIISVHKLLKVFSITHGQYHYWKRSLKKCGSSLLSLCRNVFPGQLTVNEVKTIFKYMKKSEYRNWPAVSVYYKAIRDKVIGVSLSTWYHYIKIMNLSRSLPENRRKKHCVGIRTDAPKKLLHMDVTIFRPMNNVRVYIYLIVDNFSRFILAALTSLECRAESTYQNLINAVSNHKLLEQPNTITLMNDGGGAENKGVVVDYVNQPGINIKQIIAQLDVIESNSMVEAANKTLKYQYLFPVDLLDYNAVVEYLPKAIDNFNNRPSGVLYGMTPKEVFEGDIPNSKNFKDHFSDSREARTEKNREYNCQTCGSYENL